MWLSESLRCSGRKASGGTGAFGAAPGVGGAPAGTMKHSHSHTGDYRRSSKCARTVLMWDHCLVPICTQCGDEDRRMIFCLLHLIFLKKYNLIKELSFNYRTEQWYNKTNNCLLGAFELQCRTLEKNKHYLLEIEYSDP